MTIYQEAHNKLDRLPEDTVFIIIQLMDRMDSISKDQRNSAERKRRFLETAGTIDIDEEAVAAFREVSMV